MSDKAQDATQQHLTAEKDKQAMTAHSIWGEDRIELHTAPSLSEARQWLAGYTRRGFGGYSHITIRAVSPEAELVETLDNPRMI